MILWRAKIMKSIFGFFLEFFIFALTLSFVGFLFVSGLIRTVKYETS